MTRHHTSTAALAAGVLLALGASHAFAGELRTSQKPIQGQYIVVLKDQAARLSAEPAAAGKARVPEVARTMSAGHGAKLVRSYEHALRGFVVQADDRALAKLLADPRVQYVEEDGYATLNATTQTGATWGLDRVDQRTLPLNGTYIYDTTASNVRAYIIDSGILTSHSQFGGRIGNGYSAIADGRGVQDCNGHGTHVAGTVGGSTWGVAKGVTLHPVRVFGCTGGSAWSTVIAGIDWVRANHIKPAVANMSLGGPANSSIDLATNNLIAAGVSVVVSAGNSGGNACNNSPARVPNAITVGSTDSNDARSSYSDAGSCLDLFAPGRNITSAWWTSTTASNTISGTSMAAPHVAGAAALYLASNPSASPATVRNILVNNATTGRVTNAGSGSPNRLLYTRGLNGTPPTVYGVYCYANWAGDNYDCNVSYASSTSASIWWSGGTGTPSGSWYYNVCSTSVGPGDPIRILGDSASGTVAPQRLPIEGNLITVFATVSNLFGSASGATEVVCPGNYLPY